MTTLKSCLLTLSATIVLALPPLSIAEDLEVRVLAQKPISRTLFTQGLEFDDNDLLISSGLYKVSKLLRLNFTSMETTRKRELSPKLFAEGLTVLNDRVYQLTWRSELILIYDKESFKELDRWSISGQGWGLTNNGKELIYSNGSNRLTCVEPSNGKTVRSLDVFMNGGSVRRLNELEWIDGEIWANIWGSNYIAIINPQTGIVTRRVNLTGLLPPSDRRRDTDVLNGIARHPETGAIWVTGTRWPSLYQKELESTLQAADNPDPHTAPD